MQRLPNCILGAFLADSHALAAHWIYDQSAIPSQCGSLDELQPPATTYHPGKIAGDLTHLGDQTLLLLQSIPPAPHPWDPLQFHRDWLHFWSDPQTLSYRDKATKTTLANLTAKLPPHAAGAPSEELGGPARSVVLAALLASRGDSDDSIRAACRLQTRLTHQSPIADAASDWIATLIARLIHSTPLADALAIADQSAPLLTTEHPSPTPPAENLAATAARIGLSCSLPDAWIVTRLLLEQPNALPSHLVRTNTLLGGDSAARALLLGAALGAQYDTPIWPATWLNALRCKTTILAHLDGLHR